MWSYDANCQGCTPALVETTEHCEDHCKQLGPMLWHKAPGCSTCKSSMLQSWSKQQTGECKEYCKYIGPNLWQYDANCNGCGGALMQANSTNDKCSTWTGGTCVFNNCDASRGMVQCNWAKACVCATNFCANDQGICIFDVASVLR